MSTPPNALTVRSTIRGHSSSFARSASTATQRRPTASISFLVFSSASTPRATIAISAPCSANARAIARPIPFDPPVMIATRSCSEKATVAIVPLLARYRILQMRGDAGRLIVHDNFARCVGELARGVGQSVEYFVPQFRRLLLEHRAQRRGHRTTRLGECLRGIELEANIDRLDTHILESRTCERPLQWPRIGKLYRRRSIGRWRGKIGERAHLFIAGGNHQHLFRRTPDRPRACTARSEQH